MKKALLAALTFIVVGFLLVNSTFALPDLDAVFQNLTDTLGEVLGLPQQDTSGVVDVALVSKDSNQQLFPGGSASRETCVSNDGTGPVYFRLVYAVQYDESSWDKLTILFDADKSAYEETEWVPIAISSIPYQMKVFTYKTALEAGKDSPAVTLTISMDTTVTSEEIARYRSDFLQTQVLAIDPTPFTGAGITTAPEALDKALPINSDFNPF